MLSFQNKLSIMGYDKLTSVIRDKYGNEWSISAWEVYESIVTTPLNKQFDAEEYHDVIHNIAGQLQFLEFTESLINNLEFEPEELEKSIQLPESLAGGELITHRHNEVEHSFYKQGIITVSSVAEAVCVFLLHLNSIKLPRTFKKCIDEARDSDLIDEYDQELLHELRKLRNSIHLHSDGYTLEFYNEENYLTAKACLYWLLRNLLKLDEKVVSIHFPYLPKRNKDELFFEV